MSKTLKQLLQGVATAVESNFAKKEYLTAKLNSLNVLDTMEDSEQTAILNTLTNV